MTLHRLIGGKKKSIALMFAAATLTIAAAACIPQNTGGGSTTTTVHPTTTTTTSTTTTIVVANPTLTVGSSTPVALTVHASDPSVFVDVNYTSAASANQRTYLYVCFEDGTSPTFSPVLSCSFNSEVTNNPTASTTGTFTGYEIFHGPEPTGDLKWGVFGSSETAPAGIHKYTTGYLRFTVGSPNNTTDQQFVPFTYTVIP